MHLKFYRQNLPTLLLLVILMILVQFAFSQNPLPTGFKQYKLMSKISDYPEASRDTRNGQSGFFSHECPDYYGNHSLNIRTFHGRKLFPAGLTFLYNSFDTYFRVYRVNVVSTFMSVPVEQIAFVVYKNTIITIALDFGALDSKFIKITNLLYSEFGEPESYYIQTTTSAWDWGYLTLHVSSCSSSLDVNFPEIIITSSEAENYLIEEGNAEMDKVKKDY